MNRMLVAMVALLAMMLICTMGTAERSTENIPACYQYVLVGEGRIYDDEPVAVHNQPDTASAPVGQVQPDQRIFVAEVDEDSGMSFILYHDDGKLPSWNEPTAQNGWIPTSRIFNLMLFTSFNQTYVVTTNKAGSRLNLRSEPNAGSGSKGKYYAGTVVKLIDAGSNGFVHVQIGEIYGYMKRSFLDAGLYTDSAELPVLTVDSEYGDGVMIHELPRTSANIIQTAEDGDEVTVLSVRRDGWYQVVYRNVVGFAQKDDLTPTLSYKTPK